MNCPGGAAISLYALISPFVFTFYARVQLQNTQTNNNRFLTICTFVYHGTCSLARLPLTSHPFWISYWKTDILEIRNFGHRLKRPRRVQFDSKTLLEGRKLGLMCGHLYKLKNQICASDSANYNGFCLRCSEWESWGTV